MTQLLLYLDPNSTLSLQAQIRSALIDAIVGGQLPTGVRMPSTRQLARQLGVSRNTVIAAVQDLIAEGFLISRERSGCYINEEVLNQDMESRLPERQVNSLNWQGKFSSTTEEPDTPPPNWRQYPFAFISGQSDESLFPISEWRECDRIAQGVRDIQEWTSDLGLADDPLLVEQIRTRLLPARGIQAQSDEILITNGGQGALALIAHLLVSSGTRVASENPGYMTGNALFASLGAEIVPLEVDGEGCTLPAADARCQIVYMTPSHQFPTGVTMSMARRIDHLSCADTRDMIIVEDDCVAESNFLGPNSPALKGIDGSGRVIYFSSLSGVLSPGLRIGYLVGPADFIRQARNLRRLLSMQPSGYSQKTAGLFLSLGHHDTLVRRLNQVYAARWEELRQAVNYSFPQPHFMITQAHGGTACWVEGPEGLDVWELVERAQQRGILLDRPGSYLPRGQSSSSFRLCINCIDLERIRSGLAELSALTKEMLSGHQETLQSAGEDPLTGDEIRAVMPGSALIGSTAYGDPYVVRIHEDGHIDITYDNAAKDTDQGRWWVENGQWWRQFTRSTYGEARGFQVVISDEVIRWFDAEGELIDTEVFIRDYEDHLDNSSKV